MKRLVVLIGLAAVLVGASACNSATPGQASASTTTAGGQPEATSPSSPSGGGTSLPVDHACSLLSSSDLAQLGASTSPTEEMVGTAHACDFSAGVVAMIVGIRTNVGLNGFQANGGTVRDLTIGRHQAKQVVDNTGSCVIGIGVTDSSRVDVTASGDGTSDPCPAATKLANIVEPKLP